MLYPLSVFFECVYEHLYVLAVDWLEVIIIIIILFFYVLSESAKSISVSVQSKPQATVSRAKALLEYVDNNIETILNIKKSNSKSFFSSVLNKLYEEEDTKAQDAKMFAATIADIAWYV